MNKLLLIIAIVISATAHGQQLTRHNDTTIFKSYSFINDKQRGELRYYYTLVTDTINIPATVHFIKIDNHVFEIVRDVKLVESLPNVNQEYWWLSPNRTMQ
jgi:hypothetical protein